MAKGIDVSYWQQGIKWGATKSEVDFVYIKVTEGTGRIEPEALEQACGAQGAGIKIGYYHFSHIETDSAIDEAHFFHKAMGNLPQADLIPVLDIETNKSGLTPAQVLAWIDAFLAEMISLGYSNVMIYSYKPFLDANLPNDDAQLALVIGKSPLWLAQYTPNASDPTLPKGWDKYAVWQFTNGGVIPGVNGKVDCNYCPDLSLITV